MSIGENPNIPREMLLIIGSVSSRVLSHAGSGGWGVLCLVLFPSEGTELVASLELSVMLVKQTCFEK